MMKRVLRHFWPIRFEPIPTLRTQEEIRSIALIHAQQTGSQFREPIQIRLQSNVKGWLIEPKEGAFWHVCDGFDKWEKYNRRLLMDDETGEVLKSWVTSRAYRYAREAVRHFLAVEFEPIPVRHTKEEIRSIAMAYAQQSGGKLYEPIGVGLETDTTRYLERPNQGPVWRVCDSVGCRGGNQFMLIDDGTEAVLKHWATPM